MGKEKPGFLTPKAIANRIKAKGLQKLRWYCQMCQKQCRDENGFKCHTMSESHQRQLLLFADNSHKFMDEFSREFNKEYVNTLKRRFGTKRVHANIVYQEYINDRNHIHMNATRWLTLTDYVQWLGRQGICVVDETEKGWFVTYIDRDPETLRRQEELEKKKKLDLDDRQRQQIYLEKQIERAKELDNLKVSEPTPLNRSEDEVVKISFTKTKSFLKPKLDDQASSSKEEPFEKIESVKKEYSDNETSDEESNENEKKEKKIDEKYEIKRERDVDEFESNKKIKLEIDEKRPMKETGSEEAKYSRDLDKSTSSNSSKFSISSASSKAASTSSSAKSSASSVFKVPEKPDKPKTALDEIIRMEEKTREKKNRKDYWLHKNIVVKIMTNKLGEKYHKKKAVVMDVKGLYTGIVKLLETNAIIELDQAHLETVLPAIGKKVLVVNGGYRGEEAILEDINQKEFNAKISIASGPLKGRVVNGIEYEDICKLHTE